MGAHDKTIRAALVYTVLAVNTIEGPRRLGKMLLIEFISDRVRWKARGISDTPRAFWAGESDAFACASHSKVEKDVLLMIF